jgi:teichuronic acid exporter
MEKSLKARTIHALSWSLIQQVAVRGLQFGVGILLARLLNPGEFGLIAMLTVFLAIAQVLLDGGFAAALIQRKEVTELHRCSIFYLNIVAALILATVLWLCAPAIATFYHQSLLQRILRILILIPVINGFVVVQNTLLIKQLDFKKQTIILTSATVVSASVALVLAWHGYGVWSLVVQQLVQNTVNAALLWFLSDWRPSWLFSLHALREMFAFGWGMLCAAVLNTANDNLFPLLIGKCFSAVDLGFFNRAQNLQSNASQGLAAIANPVTLSVFSGLQDDLVRFRSGLRKAMTTMAFLQFPMMVGLAVVAKPLILVLLTSKWSPSIVYLQLLCFVGIFYPIHVLNLTVLFALGRSDLFLRLDVYKVSIMLLTAAMTIHWGIMALILGQIACSIIAYCLNSYYTKKLINYSIWNQLQDLYPYLAASALMGVSVMVIGSLLPFGNLGQLCVRVVSGATIYYLICRGLRLPALTELKSMAVRKRITPSAAPRVQVGDV